MYSFYTVNLTLNNTLVITLALWNNNLMHANLRKYSSTLLLLMSFSQHYWLCCLFESIYEFYKCHFFVLIFISVQFDQESLSSLSQLYGHFLYAQKRIRERLQACKNHARIAAFFQVCSHLYISTKYSKKIIY